MKQALLTALSTIGAGFVRGAIASTTFFGLIWLGNSIADGSHWGRF